MFPDRQTIASRVVLDDRSRLPWRFFGAVSTSKFMSNPRSSGTLAQASRSAQMERAFSIR